MCIVISQLTKYPNTILVLYHNIPRRSHWSNKFPFATSLFPSIMSGRRFELLMMFIHLNDSSKQPAKESVSYDKLYKIRPLLDLIVKSFKQAYTPSQNIAIDESIIGFKGRLAWIQYMPKKPTKWGIKAWVLADSSNGYVWNFKLYTGSIKSIWQILLNLTH